MKLSSKEAISENEKELRLKFELRFWLLLLESWLELMFWFELDEMLALLLLLLNRAVESLGLGLLVWIFGLDGVGLTQERERERELRWRDWRRLGLWRMRNAF